MSDQAATQNGSVPNGSAPAGFVPFGQSLPAPPPDQTDEVVNEVQGLILWAADKARASQDGNEFKDWAGGLSSLLGALYPKGGEITDASANGSADTQDQAPAPHEQIAQGFTELAKAIRTQPRPKITVHHQPPTSKQTIKVERDAQGNAVRYVKEG